ncbi:MAG: hypothetical protein R3301_16235 [Saprospiraceae bacterium]|nr:hypothetical protein [Saprospiraceae bacterium]
MSWSDVGDWLKANAGTGAALVGSLLTGNVPAAVAAGVALVGSATGTDDPVRALERLQTDPATVVRLRELAVQEEASIREHIRAMKQAELEDAQHQHHETQETIRAGDAATDRFVRRTRPGQSWVSLFAALAYVFIAEPPDVMILGTLLVLPWSYAGLRQVGKGLDSWVTRRAQG